MKFQAIIAETLDGIGEQKVKILAKAALAWAFAIAPPESGHTAVCKLTCKPAGSTAVSCFQWQSQPSDCQRIAERLNQKGHMCTAEWSASGTCAASEQVDHPPRQTASKRALPEHENKELWCSTYCGGGTFQFSDTPSSQVATDAVWKRGHVTVDHAWARMVAGTRTGSGYLRITNDGIEPDRLIKVQSPVAVSTMVCEASMIDGTAKPSAWDGIKILPRLPLVLQPGGCHILLQELEVEFTAGEVVPLQLVLKKAGTLRLAIPILPLTEFDPF